MSNRSAQSGKFVNQSTAQSMPNETVRESRIETKSILRLTAKKRPSLAEKLIIKLVRELETHPKYAGLSAQQILDAVNKSK
jgi:hypothetical protein